MWRPLIDFYRIDGKPVLEPLKKIMGWRIGNRKRRPRAFCLARVLYACLVMVTALSGRTLAEDRLLTISDAELTKLTEQAYIYTLPSVVMYRIRWARLYDPSARWPLKVNRFGHARKLATPASRAVTTPNVDTLYSGAWLDLSAGPVELHVPATGARYYSLQFLDFFTNSFAYVGRRTGVTEGGSFLVAGPQGNGDVPGGVEVIRSPTNHVWLIGRFLVRGPGDLANVHALQNALSLTSRTTPTEPTRPPGLDKALRNGAEPLLHFQIANAALTDNPPPAEDAGLLKDFARIGIGPGLTFDPTVLSDRQRRIMKDAMASVRARIRAQTARTVGGTDGWTRPNENLGRFGTNYFFRALVALIGVGANIREEAMYFRMLADDQGLPANGANRYVLHFPAGGLPPVSAFWSLTLYRVEADLRKFLVPNPLNRYALSSFTEGLVYNADGSLTVYIQNDAPADELRSNWLPAPKGAFSLTLRAYQPGADLLSGAYRLPQVRRVIGD